MDEEEIIEVFTILRDRIDTLERENKELKHKQVDLETKISDAIKNHGAWIQTFSEMFATISGQYDKKNRVINLLNRDDSYWIHWNRNLGREIIHDISETPHEK